MMLALSPDTGHGATSSPPSACTPSPGRRFSSEERRVLLATPGIGHGVIDRIERAGVHSVRQLHELGIDTVVDRICDGVGNLAWRNRRRALARALAAIRPADTVVVRHHRPLPPPR